MRSLPRPRAVVECVHQNRVEELLRYDTPLPCFERWVSRIPNSAHTVERGAKLALLYASANRDPRKFDSPDALDLARDPNPTSRSAWASTFVLVRRSLGSNCRSPYGTRSPISRLHLVDEAAPLAYGAGFVIRGVTELNVRTR